MKFYKSMLMKAYFDKGYGTTSYFKYLIAFYGVSSLNTKTTMIIAAIYGVACFFIGWLWYKVGLVDAETEVGNQFNPFAKEVRHKLSGASTQKTNHVCAGTEDKFSSSTTPSE